MHSHCQRLLWMNNSTHFLKHLHHLSWEHGNIIRAYDHIGQQSQMVGREADRLAHEFFVPPTSLLGSCYVLIICNWLHLNIQLPEMIWKYVVLAALSCWCINWSVCFSWAIYPNITKLNRNYFSNEISGFSGVRIVRCKFYIKTDNEIACDVMYF